MDRYNETKSTSKEESILKALAIFQEEQQKGLRPLHRPQIRPSTIIHKLLRLLVVFVMGVALCIGCSAYPGLLWLFHGLFLALYILFWFIFGKKICKEWILLYQRFAPEKTRRACLFTPSCSEYMLLSIDKYGTCKGLIKGLRRLLRCHHPNGGIDLP